MDRGILAFTSRHGLEDSAMEMVWAVLVIHMKITMEVSLMAVMEDIGDMGDMGDKEDMGDMGDMGDMDILEWALSKHIEWSLLAL